MPQGSPSDRPAAGGNTATAFAYMPRPLICSGREISHGALTLYAMILYRAAVSADIVGQEGNGHIAVRPKRGWAHACGFSRWSLYDWMAKLRELNLSQLAPGRLDTEIRYEHTVSELINSCNFARVPLANWDCPDFKPAMRRVWMVLWSYANRQGVCFPSQKLIAKDAGISVRTVKRCIAKLEAMELLQAVQMNREGKFGHCEYRLKTVGHVTHGTDRRQEMCRARDLRRVGVMEHGTPETVGHVTPKQELIELDKEKEPLARSDALAAEGYSPSSHENTQSLTPLSNELERIFINPRCSNQYRPKPRRLTTLRNRKANNNDSQSWSISNAEKELINQELEELGYGGEL